jgi:glycosyltransferase involved in cell wall biosynthesis
MLNLNEADVVITTHYLVYGAPQALRDFLNGEQVKSLLFIGHPLISEADDGSFYELFEEGNLVKKQILSPRQSLKTVDYFWEIITNILTVKRQKKKIALYVGADCLNAFAGIMLKWFGVVEKVVFYTIDYVPYRFQNRLMNRIYHWLDRFCVKFADETWNLSSRMAEGREKYYGLKQSVYNRQKVVAVGIWPEKVKVNPFEKINQHQLLFIGHLLKKQGVQYVLQAIPEIFKHIPDFHFLIIGGGEYEPALKNLVDELNIAEQVFFTGWIQDREQLDKMMADSALGIAIYDKYDEFGHPNFTYFADPTKLKDYLSVGLPILLSDVPHNAVEIEKKECGKIIDTSPETIAASVIEIMGDEETLKCYRENALAYIKRFHWSKIFREALQDF